MVFGLTVLFTVLYFNVLDSTGDIIEGIIDSKPIKERKLTRFRVVRALMYLGSYATLAILLLLVILKSIRKLGKKVGSKGYRYIVSDLYEQPRGEM